MVVKIYDILEHKQLIKQANATIQPINFSFTCSLKSTQGMCPPTPPNTLKVCYQPVFLTLSTPAFCLSSPGAICFQLWILRIWGRRGILLIYCALKSSRVHCICSSRPPAAELRGQTHTAVDLQRTLVHRGRSRTLTDRRRRRADGEGHRARKSWRATRGEAPH